MASYEWTPAIPGLGMATGHLSITVVSAEGLVEKKMRPGKARAWAVVQVGLQRVRTHEQSMRSNTQVLWNERFEMYGLPDICLEASINIFASASFMTYVVGYCSISLDEVRQVGLVQRSYAVVRKAKPAGSLIVRLEFQPVLGHRPSAPPMPATGLPVFQMAYPVPGANNQYLHQPPVVSTGFPVFNPHAQQAAADNEATVSHDDGTLPAEMPSRSGDASNAQDLETGASGDAKDASSLTQEQRQAMLNALAAQASRRFANRRSFNTRRPPDPFPACAATPFFARSLTERPVRHSIFEV
eukprot:jgi/Chlat1/549/Chrsp103S01000